MSRQPTIAAIGVAGLVTRIAIRETQSNKMSSIVERTGRWPGGSTVNSILTATRLGARCSLITRIGTDPAGDRLVHALQAFGIDTRHVQHARDQRTAEQTFQDSDSSENLTSPNTSGARPVRGMTLPIDDLFSADLCLIDIEDLALCRFLVDLPVHTHPGARLLGRLTFLAEQPGRATAEIVERLDALVGTGGELTTVTGKSTLEMALTELQYTMRGGNLRFAAISEGHGVIYGVTRDYSWIVSPIPGDAGESSHSMDTIAGALALGLAARWDPVRTLQVSSIVATLPAPEAGDPLGLPTMDDVERMLAERPPVVDDIGSARER